MSEYINLSTLIEDPIEAFKDELEELGIFAEINEGDQIYTGSEPWAQVIPSKDSITLQGNQQLLHNFEVYVLFLRGASDSTLSDLRYTAQQGYDKLLEDQTHNDTCWHCLPNRWAPGFFSMGEYEFVGVQTRWIVKNYQTFPLPSALGPVYPTMDLVVENIVEQFKDELSAVTDLDDINEGDSIYPGEGTVAWVIPGASRISSSQRARLNHDMTVYVNLLSSKIATFAQMRDIAQDIYDTLMEDITHDQTCTACLPLSWHPGFVNYGEQSIVGVQMMWNARVQQSYTPT